MKKSLFITLFIILIKVIFMENNSYATCYRYNCNNTASEDTVKMLYYIDGKQVSYKVIREKGQKGELGEGLGTDNSKKAIRLYGEKFRYGVIFFKSKENKEEKK